MKTGSITQLFKACKVIVVASGKGGVGKSFAAVNLAIDIAKNNPALNVALFDAEDDGTTVDYAEQREDIANLKVLSGYDRQFPSMLPHYRNMFDVIIVDTAGANSDMNRDHSDNLQSQIIQKTLCQSDFILIPVPPSPTDLRKSMRFFSSVTNYVDASMGQRKALMFINKANPQRKHTREAKTLLTDMYQQIPLAKTLVRLYTDVEEAEGEFMSVNEFAPNSNAALDMRNLYKEIFSILAE